MSVEELQRLLKTADARGDTSIAALIYVLALSGIRPSEALALSWAAMDLNSGRVRIEHAVTIGDRGELVLGPPKTESSVRSVVLPAPVIHRLRSHRAAQAEAALSSGRKRPDLVFADARTGGIADYRQDVRHRLATVFNHAGLAGATAYCLRHSCASQLLAAGVSPAEIASQLGHKNARITLAIYSHALPGSAERTSATLAQRILGA